MAIQSKMFKESYHEDIKLFQTIWIKSWMGLFILALITFPCFGSPYMIYLANLCCVATVAAIGLNILTGYTGQISLGHAAFVAIGAYTNGILYNLGLPFWACLPAAGIVSALVGFLIGIPCLRLKGFYLAMVTMAFGVVVSFVIINFSDLTQGTLGLSLIRPLEVFGHEVATDSEMYYFLIVITALLVIAANNLVRTRPGRAFVAIRDRDIAAEAIGVNVTLFKILSFSISSFYAGISGAMFGYLIVYIHPNNFTFLHSIEFVTMVIVGGLGTILGSIFGAVFVTLFPELIKNSAQLLSSYFPVMEEKYNLDWNIAAFGLLIILFLIFEPKGLFSIWGRIKACFRNWPFTY